MTQTQRPSVLAAVARAVLWLEPILLFIMLVAFWQPSPGRDNWLFLLLGLPIVFGARIIVYKRLWSHFALDWLLLLFIIVSILNILASGMTVPPFRRMLNMQLSWSVLMGRVLLGMAMCVYAVEYVRVNRRLNGLLWATLALGGLVGGLGLLSTEWNSKSHQLRVIIDLFPRYLPLGTFNANEIAGALCFIAPLLAGLATYNLNTKSGTIFRAACGFGFAAVLLAIVLGQSRFALAGTLLALGLMTPLLIRRWRWRIAAWGGLVLLVVLEVMIIRNVFSPARLDIQIDRDELSASLRLGIWEQAFNILTDLPLTGVGLNQFRDGRVRALYPVAGYETRILPHTHNELLQIGTDLGIPGLVIYIGWFVVIAFVLIRCYRRGIPQVKVLAVAVGGGLLAHAVFGLGDAIPIWDRFAFIGWWLIALACATEIYQRLVSADNKA